VDLQYTGAVTPLGAATAISPSRRVGIGSSAAHHSGSAGTVGFFARRNNDGAVGLVSNNHVLAMTDEGEDGDEIVHPAPWDGGVRPRDVIARLAGGYPRIKRAKPRVDCAFAVLEPGVAYDSDVISAPGLSHGSVLPETWQEVAKVGRTTNLTRGRITAFGLNNLGVDFPLGRLRFFGQIEIQATDGTLFSAGGDSGSLLFTVPDHHPVGLLFASTPTGTAYANMIEAVLRALDVSFV
jgi:hypothetical protein